MRVGFPADTSSPPLPGLATAVTSRCLCIDHPSPLTYIFSSARLTIGSLASVGRRIIDKRPLGRRILWVSARNSEEKGPRVWGPRIHFGRARWIQFGDSQQEPLFTSRGSASGNTVLN